MINFVFGEVHKVFSDNNDNKNEYFIYCFL